MTWAGRYPIPKTAAAMTPNAGVTGELITPGELDPVGDPVVIDDLWLRLSAEIETKWDKPGGSKSYVWHIARGRV